MHGGWPLVSRFGSSRLLALRSSIYPATGVAKRWLMAEARLTLRVDFGANRSIGPGKVRLLEAIGRTGSISQAGRDLGMSYRRAWLLVDEINHIFREPLVETQMGGSGGGGARLTRLGRDVVGRYRAIEGAAAIASAADLRALRASLPAAPAPRVEREE